MSDALAMIGHTLAAYRDKPHEAARSMPGAFYTAPEMVDVERDWLFAREWVCAGRAEEVSQPGDWFSYTIAGEPVLVVHGADGRIRALSNVCRHRGMVVARGSGHADRFACPYHAWTYDTTGQLIGAPYIAERPDFDRKTCRLPALSCEIWQGFIMVNLTPDAAPFAPQVAGLAPMIANYHLESMRLRYLATETWATNWKSLMENFMEGYHLSPLHRRTLHKVNPTKLCRHFPPGEGYFGYQVGFAAHIPGGAQGHADLSEEEARTCVMVGLPPGFAIGGAGDYSSFLCLEPQAADSVRVKMGLIFQGEDWPQTVVDRAIALFQETMAEDKDVLVAMMHGLGARHHATGPLAPAAYEGPIWDFTQYLARRLAPAFAERAQAAE
ncbi:MAG: aromatic ring-hydroxylating dioxygenase subunit alpha [Alphaproteobacteria bacterium]